MALRRNRVVLVAVAFASSVSAGCNCPGPGEARFSSGTAVSLAMCLAKDWKEDAVVQGVFSARDNASGSSWGTTTRSGADWSIDSDGLGSTWTVQFASPSARCGPQHFGTRTFSVDARGPIETGESCTPIETTCKIGLPSSPPDSRGVVPLGWPLLTAMEGYHAPSAVLLAENLYDCRIVDGSTRNVQHWNVWAYWTEEGVTHQGVVDFDAKGAVRTVRGPCRYDDLECLHR